MRYKIKIREMPLGERPRERLMGLGPSVLSNAELLAIILRTGTRKENVLSLAQRLLKHYNIRQLSQLSIPALKEIHGISDAKACQICACFELARRLASFREDPKPKVKSSEDAYKLTYAKLRDLKKEEFHVLYLDAKNRLIKEETISLGTLTSNVIHPREVFKPAVQHSAAALILVHNHPSGDPNPSEDDVAITSDMVKAGEVMGIEVLDHVIVGDSGFVSMKEKGLM
jgi:DNA repair protein RadC